MHTVRGLYDSYNFVGSIVLAHLSRMLVESCQCEDRPASHVDQECQPMSAEQCMRLIACYFQGMVLPAQFLAVDIVG